MILTTTILMCGSLFVSLVGLSRWKKIEWQGRRAALVFAIFLACLLPIHMIKAHSKKAKLPHWQIPVLGIELYDY